ncbi:hypothetical protein [Streptomyces collinus]|uniref:hypothetical protein n=1 Tax=Streptomyces collinus TaxID=42684 RepID=UPI0036374429
MALSQLDRWIADEEQREADRSGEERHLAPPAWPIQYGLNHASIDTFHTGEYWAATKTGRCRPAAGEQTVMALPQNALPCTHCQMDTNPDVLD